MSKLSSQTSVGQWVTEQPAAAGVFETFQIDYCCGGQKSLEQACHEQRLNLVAVLAQLSDATSHAKTAAREGWSERALVDLCDHIERTHHAYLKAELPRLEGLLAKVLAAHGAKHPELAEVRQAFSDLQAELGPHMFREEHILFPAIRQLEQATGAPCFPFGTLGHPIRVMEHEHENAGAALKRIRHATENFNVPGDACNTYRVLLAGLEQLEQDMHQHVHKENNILFPHAMRLEQLRATL